MICIKSRWKLGFQDPMQDEHQASKSVQYPAVEGLAMVSICLGPMAGCCLKKTMVMRYDRFLRQEIDKHPAPPYLHQDPMGEAGNGSYEKALDPMEYGY